MEDNSESVKIGKALHEEKAAESDHTEISIENIKVDKLTSEYLTEVKKSDADVEASRWQLLFYLRVLKEKGIIRKGKLEFIEKRKTDKKTYILELTDEIECQLEQYMKEIIQLVSGDEIPERIQSSKCRKCAYYEYCYI